MAKNINLPLMPESEAKKAGYIWRDELAELVGTRKEVVRCRLFRALAIANKYAVYVTRPDMVGNYRKMHFPSEELLKILSRPVKENRKIDYSTTYEQAINDGYVWRDALIEMTGLSFVQIRYRLKKLQKINPELMKKCSLRLKQNSTTGAARILYRPEPELIEALRSFVSRKANVSEHLARENEIVARTNAPIRPVRRDEWKYQIKNGELTYA